MKLFEVLVAAVILAAIAAGIQAGANELQDALDRAIPSGLAGVPASTCVQDALTKHGVSPLEELNASTNGITTLASADIAKCVQPDIPDWLTQALNDIPAPYKKAGSNA